MSLPNSLFKYQSFEDQHSIKNMKNSQIYFSHPNRFNDPYDCKFEMDIIDPPLDLYKSDLEKAYQKLKKEKGIAEEQVTEMINKTRKAKSKDEIPTPLRKVMRNSMFKVAQASINNEHGVCCFSGHEHEDILMWAYYADGHSGFCLEFDTTIAPFDGSEGIVKKVEYIKDKIPQLRIGEIIKGIGKSEVVRPFSIKHKSWEHEDEYRLIHNEVNKIYNIPWRAVIGVYFGSETTEENKKRIAKIVKRKYNSAKLYESKKMDKRIEIEYEEKSINDYL